MVTVTLILKFWILLYNNIYTHTFLVVAHQDCTNLRRGFSPLIYTGALKIVYISIGRRSGDWTGTP